MTISSNPHASAAAIEIVGSTDLSIDDSGKTKQPSEAILPSQAILNDPTARAQPGELYLRFSHNRILQQL